MKRIIFSVWADVTEKHQSVPHEKKLAFTQYKDKLVNAHKRYATLCNSEYHIFSPELSNYDDIQFYKLNKFEELTQTYDEVVYLDLDVVPTSSTNIFDVHASNKHIGVHFIDVNPRWYQRVEDNWWIDSIELDKMNMVVKSCCKNAMLNLVDVSGNNSIANTGVLIGNKNSIQDFNLSERLVFADKIFYEAKDDNIYPNDISNHFEKNNEVYFSFIKEYYNLEINKIGLSWNWIIDRTFSNKGVGVHLQHVVNKKFSMLEEFL